MTGSDNISERLHVLTGNRTYQEISVIIAGFPQNVTMFLPKTI